MVLFLGGGGVHRLGVGASPVPSAHLGLIPEASCTRHKDSLAKKDITVLAQLCDICSVFNWTAALVYAINK